MKAARLRGWSEQMGAKLWGGCIAGIQARSPCGGMMVQKGFQVANLNSVMHRSGKLTLMACPVFGARAAGGTNPDVSGVGANSCALQSRRWGCMLAA